MAQGPEGRAHDADVREVQIAPEASDEGPASMGACTPPPSPPAAQSSITIAFGERVRVTIEGAPDSMTLSKVIGALRAPDRFR